MTFCLGAGTVVPVQVYRLMNKAHLNQAYAAFARVRTPREAKLFLEDILTPKERASVAERLQIFKLLSNGVTQREISKELNVSISKVIRGAHAWRTTSGGMPLILKRIFS